MGARTWAPVLSPPRFRRERPSFLSALIAVAAFLLMATSNALGQNITLSKSSLTASPIPSGQDFEYQITYTFSSTSGDFVGAVIEDQLPAGLIYAGTVTANPQVASTTAPASGATGRIRFNMVNPIAAGSSGNLRIRVRYPIGTTADGLQVTNVATASGIVGGNLISATSNPVITTASAGCA